MRVRVHFNLRTRLWSVVALEGERRGKVIAHERRVMLTDCRFHVSETSRQRVIRRKCREVHAWVSGRLSAEEPLASEAREFTYNPYRSGAFTTRDDGAPLTGAARVWFLDRAAWAS